MDQRLGSQYADHPRVTWYADGEVAYIDFTGMGRSWSVISQEEDTQFRATPPNCTSCQQFRWFDSMDAGIEYAFDRIANSKRRAGRVGAPLAVREG